MIGAARALCKALQHMALMVLPAEEDGKNTHGLFALIDIEIKNCLIFRYPAKAG